jgi:hypothetical protein
MPKEKGKKSVEMYKIYTLQVTKSGEATRRLPPRQSFSKMALEAPPRLHEECLESPREWASLLGKRMERLDLGGLRP